MRRGRHRMTSQGVRATPSDGEPSPATTASRLVNGLSILGTVRPSDVDILPPLTGTDASGLLATDAPVGLGDSATPRTRPHRPAKVKYKGGSRRRLRPFRMPF